MQSIEEYYVSLRGNFVRDLSPATKFIFVLCVTVLSIFFGSSIWIIGISILYGIVAKLGKCLKPFLKSYMRVFLFFGIFLILIHAIFHDEGAVLFTIIHITFKEEGLRRGIFMSAIILTIAGGMILFHRCV